MSPLSRGFGITLLFGVLAVPSTLHADFIANTFDGDSAGERFGLAVSSAGDIDGDGVDDIAVGAPFETYFGVGRGSVRVISGLTRTTLLTLRGDSGGDQYGTAVAGGGDINNDGYDDLIVGAPTDDSNGNNSGSVYVVSGEWIKAFAGHYIPDTPRNLLHLKGEAAGDNLGTSVAFLGDVNSDGVDDLIAGAPGADGIDPFYWLDAGRGYVYSGSDGSVLSLFAGGFPHEGLGRAVARAGDVNNDGETDVILGGPSGLDFPGVADVYSASGQFLYEFVGEHDFAALGAAVAGVGDVNGDGYDDVLVGSPGWSNGNNLDVGQARVFSGRTGGLLYLYRGRGANENFGAAVAGVGDLDGDLVGDFVIGAPLALKTEQSSNYEGSVDVLSGATGAGIALCWGEAEGDRFGSAVGGIGDLTGDGVADVLVGSPNKDLGGLVDAGRAYVLGDAPSPIQGPVSTKPESLGGLAEYQLGLSPSRPNPFADGTTIRYVVPRDEEVKLRVYSVEGRLVRTLVDEAVSAGPRQVRWDGRDDAGHALPTGVYLYRLEVGTATLSRKALLLR